MAGRANPQNLFSLLASCAGPRPMQWGGYLLRIKYDESPRLTEFWNMSFDARRKKFLNARGQPDDCSDKGVKAEIERLMSDYVNKGITGVAPEGEQKQDRIAVLLAWFGSDGEKRENRVRKHLVCLGCVGDEDDRARRYRHDIDSLLPLSDDSLDNLDETELEQEAMKAEKAAAYLLMSAFVGPGGPWCDLFVPREGTNARPQYAEPGPGGFYVLPQDIDGLPLGMPLKDLRPEILSPAVSGKNARAPYFTAEGKAAVLGTWLDKRPQEGENAIALGGEFYGRNGGISSRHVRVWRRTSSSGVFYYDVEDLSLNGTAVVRFLGGGAVEVAARFEGEESMRAADGDCVVLVPEGRASRDPYKLTIGECSLVFCLHSA